MAVQLKYNDTMGRYDVLLPFTLENESSELVVAAISEDERLTLHRDLKLSVVRQILLKWDEKVHMETVKFDELWKQNNNKKGDK
jgi:hypothetical protein